MKDTDVSVLGQPPVLHIVWYVAPHEITTGAVPGRSFCPSHTCIESLDGGVNDPVFSEPFVEHNDIRVGIPHLRRILSVATRPCEKSSGGGCGDGARYEAATSQTQIRFRSIRVIFHYLICLGVEFSVHTCPKLI